jgi:beta-xylosidase
MIEAAMIWNEPNNKSHWDPEVDPDWTLFGETVIAAAEAIRAENPSIPRVLGGMSPIDPSSSDASPATASWTMSTWSPCTASPSTGTCGRSRTGRQNSTRSGP